jgi:predicted anti-sigma-YlaC factor YlaD
MDCAGARQAMLEADPADLAGEVHSELGHHLASCAACRDMAAAILAVERGLAAQLAAARPRGRAAEAIARVAAAARRRSQLRRAASAGSLLAAAALAALLLLPRDRLPVTAAPAVALTEPQFSVAAAPGQSVVVMHTANPKIIVVWYLPSRRGS